MKKYWRRVIYHKICLITDHNNSINNYKEPCKLPTDAIIMVGCDDKSKIQVGYVIPLEVNPSQSNYAIVLSGTSVQACDNYYVSVAKTIPSVIHNINQSRNPVDSLYIGGPDGRGCTFVLLYDATFDPSLVYKHFAHFHQFLLYLAHSRDRGVDTSIEDVESLEYMLLFECNGGLDHNLTFLANQL